MSCEQTLNNLPHLVIEENTEATDRVPAGTSRRVVWSISEPVQRVSGSTKRYGTPQVYWKAQTRRPTARISGKHSATRPRAPSTPAVGILCESIGMVSRTIEVGHLPKSCQRHRAAFLSHRFRFHPEFAVFTNPPEPDSGLMAMKKTMLNNIRISTSPWAVLKDTEPHPEEGRMSPQSGAVAQAERNHFFNPTRTSAKIWHTDTADASGQVGETSVANYLQDTVSEKLTVFWNHIKTEL